MKVMDPPEQQLNLEEGYLCLEFCNTVDMHASAQPYESLNVYHDLINWALGIGLLDAAAHTELEQESRANPSHAREALEKAIALREAIYRIFVRAAAGEPADPADLDKLNAAYSQAMMHAELVPHETGFSWRYNHASNDLEWPLYAVARSAASLLTSDQLHRVGECADEDGCGWLFFDTSRNRSRRWCSMGSCGNRAKAQRHYYRERE